jgi:hypothetical protein
LTGAGAQRSNRSPMGQIERRAWFAKEENDDRGKRHRPTTVVPIQHMTTADGFEYKEVGE